MLPAYKKRAYKKQVIFCFGGHSEEKVPLRANIFLVLYISIAIW